MPHPRTGPQSHERPGKGGPASDRARWNTRTGAYQRCPFYTTPAHRPQRNGIIACGPTTRTSVEPGRYRDPAADSPRTAHYAQNATLQCRSVTHYEPDGTELPTTTIGNIASA